MTFSEDDAHLADVRRIALALPEAVEKTAWGRPTFRAGPKGKIFALTERSATSATVLVVKPEPGEREALLADPRFGSPAYWGPSGWVGLDLGVADVDLDEVAELVESSYRQVALRRQLAALDRGTTDAPGPDETFEAVAAVMLAEHPTDAPGRMLHAPGLRCAAGFYAFVTATDLVVKLPADRVAQLVAAGTGRPCSPRPGRPMREWVALPDPDTDTARTLVRAARAFVVRSPPVR